MQKNYKGNLENLDFEVSDDADGRVDGKKKVWLWRKLQANTMFLWFLH